MPLAGSVLWPESFAYGITVFSVAFIVVEISAIICSGNSRERNTKE
jgi:hypothetical protein